MDSLNKSGKLFLTHTVLNGQFWLRMSIGQTQTKRHHVKKAWSLLQETVALLDRDWIDER